MNKLTDIQKDNIILLHDFLVYLKDSGRIGDTQMFEKSLQSFCKSINNDSPTIDELTEDNINIWIDDLLTNRTLDTITRYIASLSKIYKYAVMLGYASDRTLLTKIKKCVIGLNEEGIDKRSHQQLENIRRLSNLKIDGKIGKAVDILLYSFYNAGMSISDIIELRSDSDSLSSLPHSTTLREKYRKETRKYVFPLQQWQQSTKSIQTSLEQSFKVALRLCNVDLKNKTVAEFITESWTAVAKIAHVSTPDICAFCPSLLNNPKLKNITPSTLSLEQREQVMLTVANTIIDKSRHWYAIKFGGDETIISEEMQRIAGNEHVKIYYPIEEIFKKSGKRVKTECRPCISNILFIQTYANTIVAIQRDKPDFLKYGIIRKSPTDRQFAIISDNEMRQFSIMVSNGHAILSDDDIKDCCIEVGSYVRITDGTFKGYAGRVLKITHTDTSQGSSHPTTMLQIDADTLGPNMGSIFGKHLNITIPEDLVFKNTP